MPSASHFETVRRLFAAYRADNRAVAEELLSEKFTFSSPYDERIDRTLYFQRCWPNNGRIQAHDILALAEYKEDVFVLYECTTKSAAVFRNTERFRFDGDKISSVEVFFGDPPAGVSKDAWREATDPAVRDTANASQIRALLERRIEAIRAKDAAAAVADAAADVHFFDVVGPPSQTGAEVMRRRAATWFKGFAGPIDVAVRDLEIVVSADVGFSCSLNHYSGALLKGGWIDMQVRVTTGYRRLGERWYIVHEHNSAPLNDTSKPR